jgi:fructokinase
MMLTREEVNPDIIKAGKIFHFGTLSSTHEGVREATRDAIRIARENGLLISFDPNLREPLWASLEQAREEINYGLSQCDILKISDNEIEFMTGTSDYTQGVQILRQQYELPLIFVTMGKAGSRAYYKDMIVEAAPFLREDTIETTGAGDTFGACALNYILEHGMDNLTEADLLALLRFANAGASIITSRKGALKVMPERSEIEQFLAENGQK